MLVVARYAMWLKVARTCSRKPRAGLVLSLSRARVAEVLDRGCFVSRGL